MKNGNMLLWIFLLLSGSVFFSSCAAEAPVPDSIVVSPSPVHVLSIGEEDIKPDITVTVFLKDRKTQVAKVWLDAIATAKFGTQVLAAREEMVLVGRTRSALWVYQWTIPGYLLDTENINEPDKDIITVYVQAEDAIGKVQKLGTVVDLNRGDFEIQPTPGLESLVVASIDQIRWNSVGYLEFDQVNTRLLLCRKPQAESTWREKGCDKVELTGSDLQGGGTSFNDPISDGHYWWLLQLLDTKGTVMYQSPVREVLVDPGNDDWVGISLSDGILNRSNWAGETALLWLVYRDGVLINELPITGLSWDVTTVIEVPGYYEVMIVRDQKRRTDIISNTLRIVVHDQGQVVSLQDEFSLSDGDVEQLNAIMEQLMIIPPEQVEHFVTRMVFRGVVDAEGLRLLLDELGLSNRDIERMAERGQVEELTRIFAMAYVRDLFQLDALQEGVIDYLGNESD